MGDLRPQAEAIRRQGNMKARKRSKVCIYKYV